MSEVKFLVLEHTQEIIEKWELGEVDRDWAKSAIYSNVRIMTDKQIVELIKSIPKGYAVRVAAIRTINEAKNA